MTYICYKACLADSLLFKTSLVGFLLFHYYSGNLRAASTYLRAAAAYLRAAAAYLRAEAAYMGAASAYMMDKMRTRLNSAQLKAETGAELGNISDKCCQTEDCFHFFTLLR